MLLRLVTVQFVLSKIPIQCLDMRGLFLPTVISEIKNCELKNSLGTSNVYRHGEILFRSETNILSANDAI